MAAGDVIASGNFQGSTALRGKVYWSQRETSSPGVSQIIVDLYIYSQYRWGSNALSGTYITINGNKKSITSSVNVSGSGERKIMTHSVTVTHQEGASISIATGIVVRGTYQGTYYDTISTSSNITLKSPALLQSRIKTGTTTYSPIKAIYVKTGTTTYSKVKAAYIKTGTTTYSKIK